MVKGGSSRLEKVHRVYSYYSKDGGEVYIRAGLLTRGQATNEYRVELAMVIMKTGEESGSDRLQMTR